MDEWSTLEYMDYWLRTIYSHTSQNSTNSISNNRLSPPILVVGTHRNNLSQDEVEQKRLVRDIHLSTIQQIYPKSNTFMYKPIDLSTVQQIYTQSNRSIYNPTDLPTIQQILPTIQQIYPQ